MKLAEDFAKSKGISTAVLGGLDKAIEDHDPEALKDHFVKEIAPAALKAAAAAGADMLAKVKIDVALAVADIMVCGRGGGARKAGIGLVLNTMKDNAPGAARVMGKKNFKKFAKSYVGEVVKYGKAQGWDKPTATLAEEEESTEETDLESGKFWKNVGKWVKKAKKGAKKAVKKVKKGAKKAAKKVKKVAKKAANKAKKVAKKYSA